MPLEVTMAGAPRERGRAYGEHARHLVAEAADRWPDAIGPDADRVLDGLVEGAGLVAAASARAPELAAEVEGIAEGSGVDRRRVWALNLLDESWWMSRSLGGGCTCFASKPSAPAGQPTIVGQNLDLPGWTHGLQVLLDIRPEDGLRVLAPAYAGIIATHAVNEQAVVVAVNALSTLPHAGDGLPVAFLIRLAAAQPTARAAAQLLRAAPHASGQNYLLADPDELIDLECGAGAVREVVAQDGRIAHTNHPLDEEPPPEAGVVANSGARLAAVQNWFATDPVVDAAAALDLLQQPPLARPATGAAFTFSSTVIELTRPPVLHLADGPPPTPPLLRRTFDAPLRR